MGKLRYLYASALVSLFCLVLVSGVLSPIASAAYLPPDEFFETEDDYSIEVLALQTNPNTPLTSASGLKGIMLNLLGAYDPPITQFRYQSNTSTNYTYVNDIQPDYPWMCSAAIFAIVLFCVFKLLGGVLSWLK